VRRAGYAREARGTAILCGPQSVDIRSGVSEQNAGFQSRGVQSLRELDLGHQVLDSARTGPGPGFEVICLSDVERQQQLFAMCPA